MDIVRGGCQYTIESASVVIWLWFSADAVYGFGSYNIFSVLYHLGFKDHGQAIKVSLLQISYFWIYSSKACVNRTFLVLLFLPTCPNPPCLGHAHVNIG